MLLVDFIAAAVEDHSSNKPGPLCLVLKLTGDIAEKVPPLPGIGRIYVHIRPQISIQRALRLLVGGLVDVAGVGFPQEHNLKRVDDGGFPRAVFPRQKVDIPHLDDLFGEVEPVNQ